MNLVVVGLSHKKAPLELREQFGLNEMETLRKLSSACKVSRRSKKLSSSRPAIAWSSFW